MTKCGASRPEWNLRGGNTWGDMKVSPLNDLCEGGDFGNGSHPIFSIKGDRTSGGSSTCKSDPWKPKTQKDEKKSHRIKMKVKEAD